MLAKAGEYGVVGDLVEAIIAYARRQIGRPYIWGGTGPAGYDCSGIVYAAYKAADLTIPRTTFEQWPFGIRVPAGQEQPGDLVFFSTGPGNGPGRPGHVALVIGDGQAIEARCSRTGWSGSSSARAVRTAARLTPWVRARAAIEVPWSRKAARTSSSRAPASAGGRPQ